MRAIIGRETPIYLYVEDQTGDLADADSTPTVAVTDWNGDAVAGVSAVEKVLTGTYKAVLPVASSVDRYTVVWSATAGGFNRSYSGVVPVVAGTATELRSLKADPELRDLEDLSILDVRDSTDDTLEDIINFPLTTTVKSKTFMFRGGVRLRVPDASWVDSVLALTINDTVYDPADLEVTDGDVYIADGTNQSFLEGYDSPSFPAGRVQITVTHGPPDTWDNGIPGDIRRAAVVIARYTARTNNYPERARMIQTDGAMITFSMASPERPTGLPDVDGILTRYRVNRTV